MNAWSQFTKRLHQSMMEHASRQVNGDRSEKMDIKRYRLSAGILQKQSSPDGLKHIPSTKDKESWFDIAEAKPEELRLFLDKLGLHPVQIARCVDSTNDPGVISFGETLLMEYPTAFDAKSDEPGYLTIIINKSMLITVRHSPSPALDELINDLTINRTIPVQHLAQIAYLILDQFADLNVDAQIDIREQITHLSKTLAENPGSVKLIDLSRLRLKVDKLVSLLENQLYCVSSLSASDNKALQEAHRKAFIQDLVSEAEIAQRGIYRLENRLNNLYSDYQMVGNDLVEKRLRFLTIVSMITLPFGLIAGLLGMNVGGLPGTSFRYGFLVVVVLMLIIGLLQYWYFKRNGWFD
jgi:Mg2+ and Co2+ transporter CorA